MSKIKDDKSAKGGISALFGGYSNPETGIEKIENVPVSREEVVESLSEETRTALQEEIQRRKYLKSGRPPGSTKGSEKKKTDYIRMTFLIDPAKQERLREIALREGLFLKEILDRGIDLVIAEYESKEGKV